MSKLSRYNLLISLVRHELEYEHILPFSTERRQNILLYQRSVEGWVFLLEDLMCENSICEQARDTRIHNLLNVLNHNDASFTFPLLKKIYDVLINHISAKQELVNFCAFKGQ